MKKSLSFKTKFGWMVASEEQGRIIELKFSKIKKLEHTLLLKKLKKKVNDFFLKKSKSIRIQCKLEGNSIQKKVWNELKKIKYGKTQSYGSIAKKLKISPRYVGKICGQNKHILLIPCHRVIRSDGSLGGFSCPGGIKTKQKLLNLEQL